METEAQRRARLAQEEQNRAIGALLSRPDVQIGEARIVEATPSEQLQDAIREARATEGDADRIAREDSARRQRAERAARAHRDLSDHRRREQAYERSTREGVEGDIMGFSNRAEALRAGTLQGMSLGLADEGAGVIGALMPGDTYAGARDRAREYDAESRAAAPGYHTAGRVWGGTLPALAVPGASAGTLGGRILQSGLAGAALGGVEGYGSSEADDWRGQLADTAGGAAMGFAGGATGQAVGEATDAVRRVLRGEPALGVRDPADLRYDLDRRTRAATDRRIQSVAPDITDARLAEIDRTYPGGREAYAEDLRASGISPRGGTTNTEAAQRRAWDVIDQAPQNRQAVDPYSARTEIVNTPEELAQFRAEYEAREAARAAAFREDELAAIRAERATPSVDSTGASPRARRARPRPAAPAQPIETPPVAAEPSGELDMGDMFGNDAMYGRRAPVDAADGGAGQRANIRAAERRAERGGFSRATQDERTYPVDLAQVEDITPQPPPLPRRAPEPAPTTPAPQVSETGIRWDEAIDGPRPTAADADQVRRDVIDRRIAEGSFTPPEPVASPAQQRAERAATQTRELGVEADTARRTMRQSGTWRERAAQHIDDLLLGRMRAGTLSSAQAAANERAVDAIGRELERQARAGSPSLSARFSAARSRGPQVLGNAIRQYMRSGPEAQAQVIDAARAVQAVPEDDPSLFTGGNVDDGNDSLVPDEDPDLF